MSPIDCFEERHFKNNSWRNEYTQQKYAKMIASREEALTQAQAQAQVHEIADPMDPALSAEFVVGPISIDEYAIMTQSLGTRSRWQKGIGSLSRLKSVGGPRATSISNVAAVQHKHTETITSLKQQLAEKDAEHQCKLEEHQAETQRHLNDQQQLLQSLIAQLGNNGLNIQLSLPTQRPPPLPSQ
ncbi:hypothetical protein PanWU01x14_051470 [Parasponia andersonii]|uniref:Transposase, Ptta/En/Spm, plant n=1 Tax=Parasponia andersonii TaxID=3476 RepID=A0A2P5DM11_PARAD|nr:hypothetical protein PanWU01x14_051470 [Parasponia andersonii]